MVSNFLIFCSGASKGIISQCPSPEKNRFATIGATVLLTAILAAISGGYALHSVFVDISNRVLVSFFFGLLWGVVIFNLDRYIVSSLRKEGNIRREFLFAAPRFIIALLISFIISKPFEVVIFESRIQQQILEDKRKKLEEEKLSIDKLNDVSKLENLVERQRLQKDDLSKLKGSDPPTDAFKSIVQDHKKAVEILEASRQENSRRIEGINALIHTLNSNPNNYNRDALGVSTGFKTNIRQRVNDLIQNRKILKGEIDQKQTKVNEIEFEIRRLRSDYEAEISLRLNEANIQIVNTENQRKIADSNAVEMIEESKKIKNISYTNNFITQVEALGNLTAKPFTTIWWTSLLLRLLFLTLETAPVVVKLLSRRGPYDELLERVEYEHFLEQQRIISEKNNELNNILQEIQAVNQIQVEMRLVTQKAKLDAELKANDNILNEIVKYQTELASIAVNHWYKKERARLEQEPPL